MYFMHGESVFCQCRSVLYTHGKWRYLSYSLLYGLCADSHASRDSRIYSHPHVALITFTPRVENHSRFNLFMRLVRLF